MGLGKRRSWREVCQECQGPLGLANCLMFWQDLASLLFGYFLTWSCIFLFFLWLEGKTMPKQKKTNYYKIRRLPHLVPLIYHQKHFFLMFQSCFCETSGNILCNGIYNKELISVYKAFDNITVILQSKLKTTSCIFKGKHALQKRYEMRHLQAGVISRTSISHKTASTLQRTLISSTSDTCFHHLSIFCLLSL